MNNRILDNHRIAVLDRFVGNVLEAYKSGAVDLDSAVLVIGHIFSAIDQRNETEVQTFPKNWKP